MFQIICIQNSKEAKPKQRTYECKIEKSQVFKSGLYEEQLVTMQSSGGKHVNTQSVAYQWVFAEC